MIQVRFSVFVYAIMAPVAILRNSLGTLTLAHYEEPIHRGTIIIGQDYVVRKPAGLDRRPVDKDHKLSQRCAVLI